MEIAREKSKSKSTGASNVKVIQKEAFRLIGQALTSEEEGRNEEAFLYYKRALKYVQSAIDLYEPLNDEEKETLDSTHTKLLNAKTEVEYRIHVLSSPQTTTTNIHQTPKSNEKSTKVPPPRPAPPKMNSNIKSYTDTATTDWEDVKELLQIKDGVSLYRVAGDGEVSQWSLPSPLKVFQILNKKENSPSAFLLCGEWVYPLEPGQSPVLKNEERIYMFPDVCMDETTQHDVLASIGISFSESVSDALLNRFERILQCYSNFKDETKELMSSVVQQQQREVVAESEQASLSVAESNGQLVEKQGWANKASSTIHMGSQWISWGLVKGAEYASKIIQKGADSLQERIKPNEMQTKVSSEVTQHVRQLNQATGSIVQISSFLVTALGTITVNLGKQMAPHVMNYGQKMLPAKYHVDANAGNQKKFEDIKKVAASGLQGFGLMFIALEQAGETLYRSLTSATVKTLKYKYGDEVGEVTHDAVGAAGNTLKAYWNVQKLGPKAIAKRAVKDTGKAIVYEDQPKPLTQ